MATLVADALEIITDTGNGIPETGPLTAIGMASDGHIYLITGRNGLDGSKTITGDTEQETWYEGILSLDYGAWAISESADFKVAGCVAAVSGFSFSVKNTAAFHRELSDNGINLGRRRVKRYRATSTDGDTWNFKLEWSGVIDEMPWDVLAYDFRCVDATKDIFRSAPNVPVTGEAFTDAPPESQDKFLPIAIGRVAYSPLVNIKKPGLKAVLNTIDGFDYEMAAVRTIGALGFRLITLGVTFAADDARLLGKYIGVVSGGKPQAYRIRSVYPTGDVANTTFVYTDEPPDMTGFVSWDADHNGVGDNGVAGVWYVEITDYKPILVASTLPIAEVKKNSAGRPGLALYKSDRGVFDDISEVISEASLTNISDSEFPGYSVLSKSADTDGSLFTYFNIYPTDVIVDDVDDWESEDLPAVGQSAPLLFNRQIGAGHYTLFDSSVDNTATVSFLVNLPKDDILKQFEEIYVLFDLKHVRGVSGVLGTTRIKVTVQGMDFYGRRGEAIVSNHPYFFDEVPQTLTDLNGLPGEYFETSRDNADFFARKAGLDISSVIGDTKKSRAFNSVWVHLEFEQVTILSSYTVELHQIGLVGKRAVGVTSETVYGTVRGEIFGNAFHSGESWGAGRGKAHDAAVDTGVEAIEHLIRKYDEPTAWWTSAADVVAGQIVRPSADTGYLYVCTVPGRTASNTEPTWPTTPGGTVVDNTATWKLLREIPVDTETFDVANTQRADWFIGRTLKEKTSTLEYYKELCAQMFLIMLVDASGKIKVKAWRENTTPLVNFSIANGNIIEKSIGKKTYTPESQAYNDVLIRYDFNHGSGKYNRQIHITNADKPAFPASNAVDGNKVPLGTFSIEVDSAFPWVGTTGVFLVTTSSAHSRKNFDRVSLEGNADGYDFGPSAVFQATEFTFNILVTGTTEPTTSPSTSGTLDGYTTNRLLWKRYVSGIRNYSKGLSLWTKARASYVITKKINKLPESLGDCPWFIDPYAEDAAGNNVWADDEDGSLDLPVQDDHPAVFYADEILDWAAFQKPQNSLEAPDAAMTVTDPNTSQPRRLEIGDPVGFLHAEYTDGDNLVGWVQQIDEIPRTADTPRRFRLSIIMEPE